MSADTVPQLLHELKHLNNMSSPFAQKFMGKRPFSDEQYEALAKKYAKREKEESAETGAPDYELKLKLQKQLAEELAKKKESGDNSPLKSAYASGAGGSEDLLTQVPMMSQAFSNLQGQIMAGFKEQQRKKELKDRKCPPGGVSYVDSEGKFHSCN